MSFKNCLITLIFWRFMNILRIVATFIWLLSMWKGRIWLMRYWKEIVLRRRRLLILCSNFYRGWLFRIKIIWCIEILSLIIFLLLRNRGKNNKLSKLSIGGIAKPSILANIWKVNVVPLIIGKISKIYLYYYYNIFYVVLLRYFMENIRKKEIYGLWGVSFILYWQWITLLLNSLKIK